MHLPALQIELPQYIYQAGGDVARSGGGSGGLSFFDISFLTFQAVIQVFIICLSGYWAANTGLLSGDGIKTISKLNVDLFTPALIFSKLASSLSLKKLVEVILIPVFYAVTTAVSYGSAKFVSSWLKLTESESNFVTAMSVFGNSNSLPVSLTLALAYSLPNLEWDDIVDDTPDKIASRGLIYLLIFQQLGQVLRWSWGYNKLLTRQPDEVIFHDGSMNGRNDLDGAAERAEINDLITMDDDEEDIVSGTATTRDEFDYESNETFENELNEDNLLLNEELSKMEEEGTHIGTKVKNFWIKFLSVMNPPLWAMLFSIVVASIPKLKYEFYEKNGFIQNTLSSSIRQLGSVSIPLILVVLGANLAPSSEIPRASPHYKRMIIGSLLGRMVLPSIILLPVIVVSVKFIRLSILEDPIFLITSFLLITSPPAIQLSQICQLNELYQKEMAGVLFYGYAVLTLPVTIVVVVTSVAAMKWSTM